jgi:hypothetical protein
MPTNVFLVVYKLHSTVSTQFYIYIYHSYALSTDSVDDKQDKQDNQKTSDHQEWDSESS